MKSRSRTNNASLQGTATGLALLLAFAVSLATSGFVLCANASERKTTIITFDAPGAGTDSGQGTIGFDNSPNGTITGWYFDSGNAVHGYVRARDGTFIKFDAPGAGTGSGQGTDAVGINPTGTITGFYPDAKGLFHGFVRAPDGSITTFDAPGAGTGPGQGTSTALVTGLNPAGAVTGNYLDASNVNHGF